MSANSTKNFSDMIPTVTSYNNDLRSFKNCYVTTPSFIKSSVENETRQKAIDEFDKTNSS